MVLWGFEDEDDNPIRQTSGVMNVMFQDPPDTTAIAAGRNWDHLNRNITYNNNAWVNDEQVLAFWGRRSLGMGGD